MKTLSELIRAEILSQGGAISFARFMELALYCPNLGYYETNKDTVGHRGDFYTSVSVGDLFGQLLALQFAEWLEELKPGGEKLKLVEAGAHNGQLALDILSWLQSHRPNLFERVEYCLVEPSNIRQAWQSEMLKSFSKTTQWISGIESLEPFNGIIFSNELLDAFPVHRLGWDASQKRWYEWGVAISDDQFIWTKIAQSSVGIPSTISNLPESLAEILPDGYSVDICPAAEAWWRSSARPLVRGKLLAIDYGLTDDELFLPSRKNGTLRAFFKHHFAGDLLANPGLQDLTAHVNFSAIQRAGEEAGLETGLFAAQFKFLARIMEKTLKDKNWGEWTPARGRQFQTLTHPEHLGHAFRVLVQSR